MRSRSIRLIKLAGCAAAFVLLLATPVRAAEEQTHLFNAALSLTGDCKTSALDPIADPGCPEGSHPSEAFNGIRGIATDPHGDIYVSSYIEESNGEQARVDIFGPNGSYITELKVPGAESMAVDPSGHLYVVSDVVGGEYAYRLYRYDPSVYEPQEGKIGYGNPPVAIPYPEGGFKWQVAEIGVAVDTSNGHLYAPIYGGIAEFGPPTNGEPNTLLTGTIGEGQLSFPRFVAVDVKHDRLYVSDQPGSLSVVKVLELHGEHKLLEIIDGSTLPGNTKQFLTGEARLPIAADEETGHIVVGDVRGAKKAFEFDANGAYVWTVSQPPLEGFSVGDLAIDNSASSPNHRYLFVGSNDSSGGHMFAFEPYRAPQAPVVEGLSVDGVGEHAAVLQAKINPEGAETHYLFEYTTQQRFETEGFEGATFAGEGSLAPSRNGQYVSAPATGLVAGGKYRFRAVVSNACKPGGCEGEGQATFSTFPQYATQEGCVNELRRLELSLGLPDCRAFELVTPPDTKSHPPVPFTGRLGHSSVPSQGEAFAFAIEGGALPIAKGNGVTDTYLSVRGETGWITEGTSMDSEQAVQPIAIGISPDDRYTLWWADAGLLAFEGKRSEYVRRPDGSFELIGEGSVGIDPSIVPLYVSSGDAHVIFSTKPGTGLQLEPLAPSSGTQAIYDRTADGITHVVSLLPGNVTPATGVNAFYLGSSEDATAVAFTLSKEAKEASPIYLRRNDTETQTAAPSGSVFAGLSADGRYLFYVSGGDLYRFESQAEETVRITEAGDVRPVNIPASGEGAYFLSESQLTADANPVGVLPQAGKMNLYYWDGAQVRFVATVSNRDAEGAYNGIEIRGGLELWNVGVTNRETGIDPSRSSPDGSVLVFESRADLGGFEPAGHVQVYRYDAGANSLACISCSPTGQPAASDASLMSFTEGFGGFLNGIHKRTSLVANLSRDGKRVFFESDQRLVPEDNDGVKDVYEWEAQGEGSCLEADGCLFLISSGQSSQPNYLVGASESGNDVFIETNDLLVKGDTDATESVYDVRVNGGFPPRASIAGECLGDACQPAATVLTAPVQELLGSGNYQEPVRYRHVKRSSGAKHKHKRKPSCAHHKKGSRRHRCLKSHTSSRHRTRKSNRNGRGAASERQS